MLLQRAPAARGDDGPPASAPDGGAAGTTSDRTFAPARRLVVARAAVEALRLVPLAASGALGLLLALALLDVLARLGVVAAVLLAGPLVLVTGAVAAALAVAAKWLLSGRHHRQDRPLWSGFVWRNEPGRRVRRACWPCRGSCAARWPRPRSCCGCARWGRASVAAPGSRRTGCPSTTWCTSAPGPP
nr:hypothetical protein [Angustibacter aerolatus]